MYGHATVEVGCAFLRRETYQWRTAGEGAEYTLRFLSPAIYKVHNRFSIHHYMRDSYAYNRTRAGCRGLQISDLGSNKEVVNAEHVGLWRLSLTT